MYDSFLRYWRILEAIIPVKVDLIEASLASGLPCAADYHGRGQASCLGHRDDPQGAPLLPRSRQDIRLRGVHPLQRNDPICHGHKLSIMLTRRHKFVTSIIHDLSPSKRIFESSGLMHRLFSDDKYMDSRAHLQPTLLNGNRLMMLDVETSD